MFKDLKSILPKTIKRAGITNQLENLRVLELYGNIVKRVIDNSENTLRPIYVKDNILTVAALSAEAVKELRYFEAKIILEINGKIGSEAVKKINYIT